MSKSNPLGLIASYGDSDEELEEGSPVVSKHDSVKNITYPEYEAVPNTQPTSAPAGIHPAPIVHCPWSACYDENSGFTYFWNQQTNAVTWEAPPEYLLALKLAQQQLYTSGSTEVTAEEWQLYQQALAEKQNSQNKIVPKVKPKKPDKDKIMKDKNNKSKKRAVSDDEEEKIELITSYHNSDSESNDESEKNSKPPSPSTAKPNKVPKHPQKKQKTKAQTEFGPPLPPNQNYSMPIGPELPPELMNPKSPDKSENKEDDVKSVKSMDDDSQDESILLKRLKDKALLLEKLGGELPSELQKIIKDDSTTSSPKNRAVDIDDLLEEIEKKEFKARNKSKLDDRSNANSITNSPRGDKTPPIDDHKSFNSNGPSLFPSAVNIDESNDVKVEIALEKSKKENVYLLDNNEQMENVNRKKLRISNSVLPERKREMTELPTYTTKYSQFIEGFSNERTGLGFSREDEGDASPKNTINYGNGLTFTKGETLNEEKKDEDLDDLTELVEAKLKFLNQLQPCVLSPLQEMLIQMQTLVSAFRAGALHASYWRRWASHAASALLAHEESAAPPGWHCEFNRSEGRYSYRRESDGLVQYEYPAVTDTDMDICTTPPHTGSDTKEESNPQSVSSTSPPRWWRSTPPPPGTDVEAEPPPSDTAQETKNEISDELLSFYNDIAQLEQQAPPTPPPPPEITKPSQPPQPPQPPQPQPAQLSPKPPAPAKDPEAVEKDTKEPCKTSKKKSKVKLSSSLGMKHRSVSSLVAKWQQVADEIHSE